MEPVPISQYVCPGSSSELKKRAKEIYLRYSGSHSNLFQWLRFSLFTEDLKRDIEADSLALVKEDLFQAPELSTLHALDAALLATTAILEFNCPEVFEETLNLDKELLESAEEKTIQNIYILAIILRNSISAYRSALRERRNDYSSIRRDVQF